MLLLLGFRWSMVQLIQYIALQKLLVTNSNFNRISWGTAENEFRKVLVNIQVNYERER